MPEDRNPAGDLAAGLAELTELLLSTQDLEEALRHTSDLAARMVPGRPMAGVTLIRGDDAMTVISSKAHVPPVLAARDSDDARLCVEAIRTGRPVWVPDTASEHRWGECPARMLEQGVRSIYSHPLTVTGETQGALSLFWDHLEPLDDRIERTAALIAEQAGMLLTAVITTAQQERLVEQLRAALASRSVIDQALGIVMAQRRCTRERAFAILRTASQNRNVKLVDIAAGIVHSVAGSPPGRTHFDEPR
ncbi:GAF and ANTAR domain-containing protein [Nocardia alni]|uniref:GAF and ANTAR domain-containing protein n=1 Tax=Nocardia alni TaxID=2815723 RepID=UPI001C23A418|nr:GAF and ANTAR domain-containing protein [Nocardia alni]